MEFVWTDTNIDHLAKHAIAPHEAERIVENVIAPYPQMIGDDKRLVIGRLPDGRYVQVIYVPSRSIPGAVSHKKEPTTRLSRRPNLASWPGVWLAFGSTPMSGGRRLH